MWEVILEALIDALKMLPFLFLTYVLLEYLEHARTDRFKNKLLGWKRLAPVGGAFLGCVPQCGFSVAAANLFSGRIITAGTLVAVFISTSDEAIPILLSDPQNIHLILKLLLYKLLIAITAGLLFDRLFFRRWQTETPDSSLVHEDCETHLQQKGFAKGILLAALKHTSYIFLFLLAVIVFLNLTIYWIGEERLAQILMSESIWQPFIAALCGLIPNCAPSVILSQLYLSGSIGFGSLLAGLSTGAGIGIVVLFKVNRGSVGLKQNIILLVYIYIISVIAGLLLN